MYKILITGLPSVGKTTLIKKITENYKDFVIGFWTEEIRDKNKNRVGFRIKTTLNTEAIFASIDHNSKYVVGKYKVDIVTFEKLALPVLKLALNTENKITIIDEIGKMELFSNKFIQILEKMFSINYKPIIATLPCKLVHPIQKKIIQENNVKIFNLTFQNRDLLTKEIFSSINNFIQ